MINYADKSGINEGYLFRKKDSNEPLTKSQIIYIVGEASKRSGISLYKKITPHSFRRTIA